MAILVLGAVAWYGSRRKDDTGRKAAAICIVALNLLALRGLSLEVSSYYAQESAELRPRGRWDNAGWDPSDWRTGIM